MAAEIAIGILILMLFLFILIIAGFVFWLWMLIDCLKRDFKSDGEKVVWILLLIFLHLLGALIYLVIVYIPSREPASLHHRSSLTRSRKAR